MSSDKYSDDVAPVGSTIEEQLSAFVDGELPQEEMELLLRRLERGEGHRQTVRLHLPGSGPPESACLSSCDGTCS